MTEAEWLACDAPTPMIEFLRGKVRDRKFRLFCCACCRQIWGRLSWAKRRAVARAERFADGAPGWWGNMWSEILTLPAVGPGWQERFESPDQTAVRVTVNPWPGTPGADAVAAACMVARLIGVDDPTGASGLSPATLLREIFGNPFRPVTFDPAWLTSTVTAIAKWVYESRDFSAMPILADALQDAGCDNDDVLNHCRNEKQSHVRGCWVVDLILGKS